MMKEKFKVVEDEDDVVIYDESDDYVPGEIHQLVDDDADEIDIEYLLRATKQQEEAEACERRKQRWVSGGVIVAVIAFIAGVCYYNFKDIL